MCFRNSVQVIKTMKAVDWGREPVAPNVVKLQFPSFLSIGHDGWGWWELSSAIAAGALVPHPCGRQYGVLFENLFAKILRYSYIMHVPLIKFEEGICHMKILGSRGLTFASHPFWLLERKMYHILYINSLQTRHNQKLHFALYPYLRTKYKVNNWIYGKVWNNADW